MIALVGALLMFVRRETVFLLIFSLSAINTQLRKPVANTNIPREFLYNGVVIAEDQSDNNFRLKIALRSFVINNDTLPLCVYAVHNTTEPDNYLGKTITIKGRLIVAKKSHRPNMIVGKIVGKNYRYSFPGKIFNTISTYISDIFCSNFDRRYALVAQGLVLGGSSRLDSELRQIFARAGVLHILAVSGLHIGFIVVFFSTIILPLPLSPRLKFLFIVLVLLLYAGITGFRPSVLRASLMALLFGLSFLFQRQVDALHVVNISALIMLLVNPLLLFDVGAQLSFAAVYGIVYLLPRINELFLKRIKVRFVKPLLWSMATSFSAQLFVSPFLILYFNQLPTLSVFSNLLIVPLASVIVYLLFIMIFVALISVPAMNIIAVILTKLIWLLEKIAGLIASLPFSAINMSISPVFLLLFFFVFPQKTRKTALFSACIIAIFFSAGSLFPAQIIKVTRGNTLIILANREKIMICSQQKPWFNDCFREDRVDYLIARKRFIPVTKEFIEMPGKLECKRIQISDFAIEIGRQIVIQWRDREFVLPEEGFEDRVRNIICFKNRVHEFETILEPSVFDQIAAEFRSHFGLLKLVLKG